MVLLKPLSLIIGIFVCLMCSNSTQLFAADHEYCERYARHALEQFDVARGEKCEKLDYPVWSMDFKHHYDWCREVPMSEAEKGNELRVSVLRECRNKVVRGSVTGTISTVDTGKAAAMLNDLACQDYAKKASLQQQTNLKNNCGMQGPQWNENYNDHYNWCMHGDNVKLTEAANQERQNGLDKCTVGKFIQKSSTSQSNSNPRAALPLPLPNPTSDSGMGDKTAPSKQGTISALPVPVPNPTLDPGVGDKTPHGNSGIIAATKFQTLTLATAMVLAKPSSRMAVVNSLLADSSSVAMLQQLPNLPGNSPLNLTSQTLGGVTMSNNDAALAGSSGFTPVTGAKSPDDFDWSKGIFFSPFVPPPTFFHNGKDWTLGDAWVSGAGFGNDGSFKSMVDQKVAYLSADSAAFLSLFLGMQSGTYAISFKLTPTDSFNKIEEWQYRGSNAEIKFLAGDKELPLTPLSDNSGFVTILQYGGSNSPQAVTFLSLAIKGLPTTYGFGGFTITRL